MSVNKRESAASRLHSSLLMKSELIKDDIYFDELTFYIVMVALGNTWAV